MNYLSVCSGIEAASVAWSRLGWKCTAVSEIEKVPSAILAERYPDVPNWGDMTKFEEWPDANVDVLVGGTPCQSFSLAGKRGGLDDLRGRLVFAFAGIAAKYRPRWIVWENVPGVLSSNGGRDFHGFISGLVELGYCCTWRILDAQYFGLAQRRKRVFVVGHSDWRRAAAVLLESEGMRGGPAPRREKRARSAGEVETGIGGAFGGGNSEEIDVASCLTAHGLRLDFDTETFVVDDDRARRLTPREAERLQGFPDGYTNITYRGKPTADQPRYKALGNSMAVPVMEWIGRRISLVDELEAV